MAGEEGGGKGERRGKGGKGGGKGVKLLLIRELRKKGGRKEG